MKKLTNPLFLIMGLVAGFAFTSQAADKQTLCPIMIEDEIDTEEFVEYKGVKVFMCCGTCVKMWDKNPDYFAAVSKEQAPQLEKVAPKDVKPMKQLFCPVYTDTRVHPKSPFIEHKGTKVYFAKTRAKSRFEADPAKYEKNLPK